MCVMPNEADPIMTLSEVSQYLRLAESTVYRLVKEQKLPARKVGGRWRFSRTKLDEWLAPSTVEGLSLEGRLVEKEVLFEQEMGLTTS
jgi:excisionase family DNA binding protein